MPGAAQTKRRRIEFDSGKARRTNVGEVFVRDILAAQKTIIWKNEISKSFEENFQHGAMLSRENLVVT